MLARLRTWPPIDGWRSALIAILLSSSLCGCGPRPDATAATLPDVKQQPAADPVDAPAPPPPALPKLLDLGARQCVPCKKMAPILDDLKVNYAAHFETVFVDVWENPKAAEPYGIRSIPTQIFLDGAGKELYRHVGFISKDDILAKWRQLGYAFTAPTGD